MENTLLPLFNHPASINEAKVNITSLGRNMAEHAYLIGCNLIWIKSQLKHGEFLPWLQDNVWFSEATGERFIKHAKKCKNENLLLEYSPRKSAPCRISNDIPKIEAGQYRTIIIDPPWPYGTQYDENNRRVASPYPEMSLEAISAMDLPTADNCVLWFWTTHKFLPVSFQIIEDWEFDYKATLTWNKEKMGIGYWLRMQCEFCLLAIKGDVKWLVTDKRDIITEPRREHSRKPEGFYEMIKEICPKPIGEIFARQEREGIEVVDGGSNEQNKFKQMAG